jgi:hypothetical protein
MTENNPPEIRILSLVISIFLYMTRKGEQKDIEHYNTILRDWIPEISQGLDSSIIKKEDPIFSDSLKFINELIEALKQKQDSKLMKVIRLFTTEDAKVAIFNYKLSLTKEELDDCSDKFLKNLPTELILFPSNKEIDGLLFLNNDIGL